MQIEMSTSPQDRVIQLEGSEYRIYGRAWWLDGAVESLDGRITVARIHAQSTSLRYPSDEERAADPGLNPYHSSATQHGKLVGYMLGLTEADLCELGIMPGKLVFPGIVDAPRPRTNVTTTPVSLRRQQQAMDWLQNDCIGSPGEY